MAKKLISIRIEEELYHAIKDFSLLHDITITDILISSAKNLIDDKSIKIPNKIADENIPVNSGISTNTGISNIKELQSEVINDLTDLL